MRHPVEMVINPTEDTYFAVSVSTDNDAMEPMVDFEIGDKEGEAGAVGAVLTSGQALQLADWLEGYAVWRKKYEQSAAARSRRNSKNN